MSSLQIPRCSFPPEPPRQYPRTRPGEQNPCSPYVRHTGKQAPVNAQRSWFVFGSNTNFEESAILRLAPVDCLPSEFTPRALSGRQMRWGQPAADLCKYENVIG
eukprot:610302-Prorocentrum_minimum.AAC.3